MAYGMCVCAMYIYIYIYMYISERHYNRDKPASFCMLTDGYVHAYPVITGTPRSYTWHDDAKTQNPPSRDQQGCRPG